LKPHFVNKNRDPSKKTASKPVKKAVENPPVTPEKREFKGILKRRVTRRIVSANGNRGIIAASIRDSLDLVQGKGTDGQRAKTVRWEKTSFF